MIWRGTLLALGFAIGACPSPVIITARPVITVAPPADGDNDGVPDSADMCPTLAKGDEPNPERNGCPDDDNDGDGLVDHSDQCPLQPMDPAPDSARPGCRVNVVQVASITIPPIEFETGSAVILDNDHNRSALGTAFAAMRENRDLEVVEIEGHTDERGPDDDNLRLSAARAASVVAALVGRGIEATRLVAAGYGEFCPTSTGHDEAAWSANRRVDFIIATRGGHRPEGAHVGCTRGAAYIPVTLGGSGTAVAAGGGGHHHHHGHHRSAP